MVFIPNHQNPTKSLSPFESCLHAAELWPSFLGRGTDFDLDPVLDGTRRSFPTAAYVRFSERSSPKSLPNPAIPRTLLRLSKSLSKIELWRFEA
jgi:hypothetical protein